MTETVHEDNILDYCTTPANIPASVARRAVAAAREAVGSLEAGPHTKSFPCAITALGVSLEPTCANRAVGVPLKPLTSSQVYNS